MDDEFTTKDLLTAWHDTTLATELAERLARTALDAGDPADRSADEAEAVASLAEHAAVSAEAVATTARVAATRAREEARERRTGDVALPGPALAQAREANGNARDQHEARSASVTVADTPSGSAVHAAKARSDDFRCRAAILPTERS